MLKLFNFYIYEIEGATNMYQLEEIRFNLTYELNRGRFNIPYYNELMVALNNAMDTAIDSFLASKGVRIIA